eukprot:2837887-Rhodomonas_salina.1
MAYGATRRAGLGRVSGVSHLSLEGALSLWSTLLSVDGHYLPAYGQLCQLPTRALHDAGTDIWHILQPLRVRGPGPGLPVTSGAVWVPDAKLEALCTYRWGDLLKDFSDDDARVQ